MWYYEQNGQAMGPVNTTVLSTLVSSGVVQPQTLVWREGETVWNQAYQTELASWFSKTALNWVNNPTPETQPLPDQQPSVRSAVHTKNYRRSNITSLTTTLKTLLRASILLSLIGVMLAWARYDLFNDPYHGVYAILEEALQIQGASTVLTFYLIPFQNLLGIATIVVFAIWIYKACANARQLSERPMKYTPGWAVGWYFIPIACLFKPYGAMKEIYQVSTTSRFGRSKSTAIVNLWWTLWIVSIGLGTVTYILFANSMSYEAVKSAQLFVMANGALSICLTLAALVMVGRIFDGQQGLNRATTTMQPQPVA